MFTKLKKIGSMTLSGLMVLTMFSGIPSSIVRAESIGGTVRASYENGRLVIENDYISRTFSTANNKLKTEKITNKRTSNGSTDFIPKDGSEEFKIRVTKSSTTTTPITLPAISREGWSATADSYENAEGPNDGPAKNLLDNNTTSIWHTNYSKGQGSKSFPYNVRFKLKNTETFQSFSYTPRHQGENTNGNIKEYELWAATSETELPVESTSWKKISEGSFVYDGANPIYVNLDKAVTANQLKFVAKSANNGQSYAGGAEFNLHKDKAPVVKNNREFATSNLELNGAPIISETSATINNVKKVGKKVTFNFKPYTFKDVTYTISENIVMYEGDHFMRKYLEISVPDNQKASAVIDYIDLESVIVDSKDAKWTIPTNAGGIVEMDQFKANLGQPIYIQGMFMGCEFPVTDTQIVNNDGYIRYYTGKSFERLGIDNQLAKTEDGSAKYVTWQTVLGAARSTENEVIQADFFEYIASIATPSEFRIQYNSWFDNMMRIDDENILESFIEIDRELNKVEVRPLDSYVVDDGWNNYNNTSVVDSVRSGTTLNTTGFWAFNSKFPKGLTPSSELVQKFGSDFGVWVGPRGGYNFYDKLADILVKNDTGSKAGGSIDVADRRYVEKFGDMAVDWQKKYGVNYWKWDGFIDRAQYNHFPATDGVPGYANRHMTGGYQNMYHVSDMWEAWIDMFERVRANSENINKLWLSLTCYVNPSPWYLQWANSVWLQCTADQADAGSSSSKMDRQLTYRDAAYYDFIKRHEFQFPLSNIYNHDPVYGKEGTGMNINTATDEQFKNYLYMLAARGTAFWELYYSDSIMTDGKYQVTGEFLKWAEENYHMLKNAKMFGGNPNVGTTLTGNSNGENFAYGFSGFDGKDGIITLRNPATTSKDITFTFDRTIGVPEDAGVLKYHTEHSYNITSGTASTGTLEYGKSYTITLQPDEVRVLRVSKDGDTKAPTYTRAYTDGNKKITVKFNEKVNGQLFEVEGYDIASIDKSVDGITYSINLVTAPTNGAKLTIKAVDIKDLAGNKISDNTITTTYNKGNKVVQSNIVDVTGTKTISESNTAIDSNNGFTVSATVKTTTKGELVTQNGSYALGIDNDGKAYFILNGATAVSKNAVNNDVQHIITGVKENNGILKLYVDGELVGSAYNKNNQYLKVQAADTVMGNENFTGKLGATVYDIAYGYDVVKELSSTNTGSKQLSTNGMVVTVSGTSEGNMDKIFDNEPTTYWTSAKAENGIAKGNPYLAIDLKGEYIIDRVDYTKRFFNDPKNMWKCTGNLRAYVLEISNDGGKTWTQVKADETFSDEALNEKGNGGTTEITFDPVKATNIRISGTASYHWQAADVNKYMTVGDLKIFGEQVTLTNLALNKNVTGKWTSDNTNVTVNPQRPLTNAVNGNKTLDNYADFGSDTKTASSYIEVDLGKVSDIYSINLYRYWSDSRTYKGTVIALSETEDFSKPVVVYNSDATNVHKLGVGQEQLYSESSDGKTIKLPEVKKARYVRVYMNGRNGGSTNHIVELEVMGIEGTETGLNKSALISRLVELSKLDTSNKTVSSVDTFNMSINEGKEVLGSATTQDDVQKALNKLKDIEKDLVDTTNLKSAITEAENIVNLKTKDSSKELMNKIEEAKALLSDGSVDSIKKIVEELEQAKSSENLLNRGDVSELSKLVESYKSLKETDFTKESWGEYKTVLDNAIAIVNDNSNSSQKDVDTVKFNLESVKDKLKEVIAVEEVNNNPNVTKEEAEKEESQKEESQKEESQKEEAKEEAEKEESQKEEAKEEAEKEESQKAEAKEEAEKVEAQKEETKEEAEKVESQKTEAKEEAEKVESQKTEGKEEAKKVDVQKTEAKEEAKKVNIQKAEAKEEVEKVDVQKAEAKEEVEKVDVQKAEAKEEVEKVNVQKVEAKEEAEKVEAQKEEPQEEEAQKVEVQNEELQMIVAKKEETKKEEPKKEETKKNEITKEENVKSEDISTNNSNTELDNKANSDNNYLIGIGFSIVCILGGAAYIVYNKKR